MKKLLLFLLLFLPALLHAAEEDPQVAINTKLREGLRNTMLQLRDSQAKVAELQAVKLGDDTRIKDLEDKLAALTKQSSDDKLTSDKTIADLGEKLTAQDARNARQLEALAKWKEAYNKLVEQARTIDGKRAALAKDKITLTRKVEDQARRNQALYTLGKDILHRYEHYGLGDAIQNREPFTGIAKVKFETHIQDNADKLADQKIKE
jgi:hypothetical protein